MIEATRLWATSRPTQTMRGVPERPRIAGKGGDRRSEPGGMTTMSPFRPKLRRTPLRVEGDTAMMVRSR